MKQDKADLKQRDISSFFGGKSTGAPKQKAISSFFGTTAAASKKSEAVASDQAQHAPAEGKRPGNQEHESRRLKRLKQTADAPGAEQAALQEEEALEDEMDSEEPAVGAKQVSNKEASAAFGKMFKPQGSKPAADSEKKAAAGAGTAGRKAEAAAKGGGREKSSSSPGKPPAQKEGSPNKAAAIAATAGADGDASPKEDIDDGSEPAEQLQQIPTNSKRQTKKEQKQLKEQAAAAAVEEDGSVAEQEEEDLLEDDVSEVDEKEKKPVAGKQQKAKGRPLKAAVAVAASKAENVGTGAVAAAQLHASADISALITWTPGKPVPYAFLAETFESIASTTKRLEIIVTLTSAFRAVLASTPEDLVPAVYLCGNRVAPPHDGMELGLGEALLLKALAQATGRKESLVKKEYEECGDLGVVAANSRATQRTMFPAPPLTIASVFKLFREIATTAGASSQAKKLGLISKLLVASKGTEPGYIMRSLQSKLRIGLAEQSVLVALAAAVQLHSEGIGLKDPSSAAAGSSSSSSSKGKGKVDPTALAERIEAAAQVVKGCYSECPSYDVLVSALVSHPLSELTQHAHFMPGVPVRPMLAKATTGVQEVLDKFSGIEFTCEYKYDGERTQIHVLEGGKVLIYSRNAENTTPRYPDILAALHNWLAPSTKSIVIDGEAVAWDPEQKKILPFQVLSTRARKEVALTEVKVPIVVFAFDCLYLNGKSMLHEPLTARREALYQALTPVEGQLMFATTKTSNNVEELETFLNEAVDASTEGLIVKTMGDSYEPSKRSSHWLKLKKDYLEGVGDTFDLVPIGAFYGKGKRAGVYGAYLLAAYDDETETYQTISKLGTGFSEEALVSLTESLKPHVISGPRSYYQWGEAQAPDVWFDPAAVWEVKAADLSLSPVHQAAKGRVETARGISIRFPRLVRVRDDKTPEMATTAAQVADMYRQQASVKEKEKAEDADVQEGEY